MLQTSINNVKILQRSATLHRIVLYQINKITATGENGQRKIDLVKKTRLDLVKKSVDVLQLK